MAFKPDPLVVEMCLTGIDPSLPWDIRMDAINAAQEHDTAATIGALSGLLHGILDAIEARSHGLLTGQEIYNDLADGIRCRLHAE